MWENWSLEVPELSKWCCLLPGYPPTPNQSSGRRLALSTASSSQGPPRPGICLEPQLPSPQEPYLTSALLPLLLSPPFLAVLLCHLGVSRPVLHPYLLSAPQHQPTRALDLRLLRLGPTHPGPPLSLKYPRADRRGQMGEGVNRNLEP